VQQEKQTKNKKVANPEKGSKKMRESGSDGGGEGGLVQQQRSQGR
jgi:hypothetical protein